MPHLYAFLAQQLLQIQIHTCSCPVFTLPRGYSQVIHRQNKKPSPSLCKTTHTNSILDHLNYQHHNIKFTVWREEDGSLAFLDMRVSINNEVTINTTVYKKSSIPIYIRNLFEEKDKIYNLRSAVSLKQPNCNTVTYGLNSFRYKGAKIWNDLPNKIKNSITLAEFKNQIKKWQGPRCLCNMCTRLL